MILTFTNQGNDEKNGYCSLCRPNLLKLQDETFPI